MMTIATILMSSCKFEISMSGICFGKAVAVALSLISAGLTVPEQCHWIETTIVYKQTC